MHFSSNHADILNRKKYTNSGWKISKYDSETGKDNIEKNRNQ